MLNIRALNLVAALLLGGAATLCAQAEPRPDSPDLRPCSELSSLKVPLAPEHVDRATGRLVSQDRLPMRLDIGRYANLRRAVEGYWRTGVLLTAVNRDRLVAAGYDDDVAIFFLVSAVASWFHMGLDGAIYVVFIGLICLSLLLGLSGVFALTRSRLERVLGLVVLIAVVAIAYRLGGDIYVIPALVPVALVPWAIYFV